MITWLKGKKTYVVGIGWILWGAFTWFVLDDQATGWQRILEGISLITLRAGVAKAVAVKPAEQGRMK